MKGQVTPKQIERRQKKALTLKVLLLIFLTNAFTALWILPSSSTQKQTEVPKGHVILEIQAKNYSRLSGKKPAKIQIFNENFEMIANEAFLYQQKGKSRWESEKGTFVVAVKEKDLSKLAQTDLPRLYPFSKKITQKENTTPKDPQPKENPHEYQIVF